MFVQGSQARRLRYRYQTVATIPSQLSFHTTFFIPAGRVAVLALITPVRAECNAPIRLDPLPASQNLLHQQGHVVVAQFLEHPSEIVEGVFVRLQQRLLRGIGVGSVESIARPHAAHREELQLRGFAAQLDHRLKPIHLAFLAPVVALRHEHLLAAEP